MFKYLILGVFSFAVIEAQPPAKIPDELLEEFTIGGEISVDYWYFDGTVGCPTYWSKNMVKAFEQKVERGEAGHYSLTDPLLYKALFHHCISDIETAIIGSTAPWYEAIVLNFGGHPVTTNTIQLSVMILE